MAQISQNPILYMIGIATTLMSNFCLVNCHTLSALVCVLKTLPSFKETLQTVNEPGRSLRNFSWFAGLRIRQPAVDPSEKLVNSNEYGCVDSMTVGHFFKQKILPESVATVLYLDKDHVFLSNVTEISVISGIGGKGSHCASQNLFSSFIRMHLDDVFPTVPPVCRCASQLRRQRAKTEKWGKNRSSAVAQSSLDRFS